MKKVLVSPSSFGQCGIEPYKILKDNGFEIVQNPFGRKLTEKEVIELGKDCVGIVAGVEPLTKTVMDNLPNLKCISRVGVGMDSVDLEYANRKGIIVVNTPNGPTRAVAELTLALSMNLLRKIYRADENMKKGVWKKEIGNLILSKKVGIYGFGRIGKETAKMFQALGSDIITFDLYPDKKYASKENVKVVEKDELFKEADIITIHVPASDTGKPLITKNELSKMKNTAYLINVSRGGVVDENDLYAHLKDNLIAGAAIDVFAEEPYKGKFTKLDNVILTPHLGSYAKEAKLKMEIDAVKNLINSLKI